MVPLEEYATLSEDATLYETVVTLEDARNKASSPRDRQFAALVFDAEDRAVGMVNLWDVLMGLEPRYRDLHPAGEDFPREPDPEVYRTALATHGLWRQPFDDLCRNATEVKVRDIMRPISAGERIEAEATMEEAVNHMVLGSYQSLVVISGQRVLGVLYLSDVFNEVCRRIKACRS